MFLKLDAFFIFLAIQHDHVAINHIEDFMLRFFALLLFYMLYTIFLWKIGHFFDNQKDQNGN